ncbi:HTH-type transcriptional activator RhaS [Frondihabitans sp. 762G35]|uniref:AraC family transcriptional regulator n=1 Tax=Frondihabitans sp. 762G35 TaxID=1446794 RepID=UPI000D2016EA|nr:helix-turn-helix domain-containing protein [Frondihabitans sp. 762G35]ARC57896.1 HTH-type transcriptional activator RhaS [Frondihabitans sp. 762G35]
MNSDLPPLRTAEQRGSDLDEARAMYEAGYNGDDFVTELTDSPFEYRYTVRGNDEMTLRTSTFLGSIAGGIQPKDEYVVSWLTVGEGLLDVGQDEAPMVVGRPFMFPTGRRFRFEMADYRQSLVHFDARFLERIAAEHDGTVVGPVHFDHSAIPDVDRLRRWKSTITAVAKTVLGDDDGPLLRAEVNRTAAIALLETFPHSGPTRPDAALLASNARLGAAVEFVHAEAHRPLSATDIAVAAGLSLRGLQQSFQQLLAVTPMEYLRGVRLDRVRAELLELSPREARVSDVAKKWGFAHPSRFAAAYVTRFHEYPTDTLRRSR